MDKKTKDILTTILSVLGPAIAAVILQYQAEITGYVAQYGLPAVAVVGIGFGLLSAYYSKVAGKEQGKEEALTDSSGESIDAA